MGRSLCIGTALRDGERSNRVRREKSMQGGGDSLSRCWALERGAWKRSARAEMEKVGETLRFNSQAENTGLSPVSN